MIDRAGEERAVDFSDGLSLMEAIRDGGVDEILALCGGTCSCATCHVFVDSNWSEVVGPPGVDEEDLLDTSAYRTDKSRLSCQVKLAASLSGLRVTIAPEE